MQDPRMPPSGEMPNPNKPRKKKVSSCRVPLTQLHGDDTREVQQVQGTPTSRAGHNASKRSLKNEGSPLFQQQPERSNSDSLPDSSTSGSEYRALRRKYLLLEEENCVLETELQGVEDEVKALEDEKLALLDELVVLEGLIDPSELQAPSYNLHKS